MTERQTGRTTRMLEAAKAYQRDTGIKAVVICHTHNFARLLSDQHPELEFTSVAAVAESQYLRGKVRMPFYDHAVIEFIPARLSERFWEQHHVARLRARREETKRQAGER